MNRPRSFVPTTLVVATLLCYGGLTLILFVGAFKSGVSNDEFFHRMDFRQLFWSADPNHPFFGVYGPSFQILGQLAASLTGLESWFSLELNSQSFAIRHVVSAFLTLVAALAVSFTVFILTGSRVWSLWGSASLLAIPVFLGHGFFNPKDIPVASGYTLVTLSCIWALSASVHTRFARWEQLFVVVITSFGVWIMVGTRYVFVAAAAVSILFSFLAAIIAKFLQKRTFGSLTRAYWPLGGGTALGLVAVALTNPCLLGGSQGCRSGLELLPRIFRAGSEISVPVESVFLAGSFLEARDPAFWYLPIAVLAGIPLLLVFFAAIGAVFTWENLAVGSDQSAARGDRLILALGGVLILLQAGLVPLIAILSRTAMWDGQRHYLFVYPPIAVLAALGAILLWQKTSSQSILSKTYRAIIAICAAAALVFPLIDSLRLFPYSYVYVNELATRAGFVANWETDYWGTSYREALKFVPRDSEFQAFGAWWLTYPYLSDARLSSRDERLSQSEVYVIQNHRVGFGWTKLPDKCRTLKVITREFRGEEIPMSRVGICPKKEVEELVDYQTILMGPIL